MNSLLVDISIEITYTRKTIACEQALHLGDIMKSRHTRVFSRGLLAKNESDFGVHIPFQTNAGFMHLFWLSVTADKRKSLEFWFAAKAAWSD